MEGDRTWMYNPNRVSAEFICGVRGFLRYAFNNLANVIDGDCVRCPCLICGNSRWYTRITIEEHLITNGFREYYSTWYMHGEELIEDQEDSGGRSPPNEEGFEEDWSNPIEQMVRDAAGSDLNLDLDEEIPNPEAQKFYEMLKRAKEPLWDGCDKKYTQLACVAELMSIKSDCNLTKQAFERIVSAVKRWLPENNTLPPDYYHCRKVIADLGLGYQKIDACLNHCMLYYGSNSLKESCDVCHHPRFKERDESSRGKPIPYKVLRYLPITKRLQRLYMSPTTAKNMRWHKEGERDKKGMMVHPADGKAWIDFDKKYEEFSTDPRNIRLGLCTDGFSPVKIGGHSYTCWPVFVVPYNLPPGMIMRAQNVLLPLLIPGPTHPGRSIDIYLQPLIDELKSLWVDGVLTYDCFSKQNFMMKVSLMWTVSDYPGYSMLSGWTTQGRLGCPICMEDTQAFQLVNGHKTCFFDNHRRFLPEDHPFRFQADSFRKNTIVRDPPSERLTGEEVLGRVMSFDQVTFGSKSKDSRVPGYGVEHNWNKRSIFWLLPYWNDLLVRHNIDMMHLECNFFNNLFHTLLDTDKTKDNTNARKDMAEVCNRPGLELYHDSAGKLIKPAASYCLSKEDKKALCEWAKKLQFPDGYASNLSNCVNVEECKFIGMKSHDCHVFMERLLPIAFRDFVPDGVWEVLTELSNIFRDLCAKELDPIHVEQLEKDAVVTICKLEKIFPPGFFDSMEHLLVHVCYEAKVCGPVTFRWMYLFERCIFELKKKIHNKARPEASIVEAIILQEISSFCSLYFADDVLTRLNQPDRYDCGEYSKNDPRSSVVSYPGRTSGKLPVRDLSDQELKAATLYVLLNCPEMSPFIKQFDEMIKAENSRISNKNLERKREEKFPAWIRQKVLHDDTIDRKVRDIALGPSSRVTCFNMYDVNGYRFHTRAYGANKKTTNSGVCVKGSNWQGALNDYYGIIEEIIQLEYAGANNRIVLFKCHWFDTIHGVRVDEEHGLVEINHRSSLRKYEPFVLAFQVVQVYYVPYPSRKRERRDWWVALKTKPRLTIPVLSSTENIADLVVVLAEFFQEDRPPCPFIVTEGSSLDEPTILQANRDPEIVPEDEIPQVAKETRKRHHV